VTIRVSRRVYRLASDPTDGFLPGPDAVAEMLIRACEEEEWVVKIAGGLLSENPLLPWDDPFLSDGSGSPRA
jgi:hypothetical protein